MKLSDKGLAAIVLHEGIVPGPYKDSVGVWTYGIGHTAGAGKPYPANMPRGMPADLDAELVKVVELFRKDLAKFEARVNEAVKVPVSQHEYDAAVSFDFNTGGIHRAEWVRTLNAGDRGKAAQQIMNWQKPSEIIPRRKAEQRLFRDGVYPTGKATVWQVTESGSVIWRAVKQVDPLDLIGTAPGVGWLTGLFAALANIIQSLLGAMKWNR